MKNVYICSPLSGRRACAPNFALLVLGIKYFIAAAIEFRILKTTNANRPRRLAGAEILDDNDPEQRELGMRAGLSLLWECSECWVFGDRITEGMSKEIRFAQKLNITIRKFSDDNSGGTIREKN